VHHTGVDDLDASSDAVGTYRFALEGVEYEIDLSRQNLDTLRAALAPFISAARRQPKSRTTTKRGHGRATGVSPDAGVRDWWATHEQDLKLPPHRSHGPIPQAVRAAYSAAH
jgi:hypothetical protein